eukprot:4114773-Pyramimonas_sp.AAC.1
MINDFVALVLACKRDHKSNSVWDCDASNGTTASGGQGRHVKHSNCGMMYINPEMSTHVSAV